MLSAIIVAGGSSRRMGFDKTFALVAGDTVIAHSIAAFDATSSVGEIIIVGREERLEEVRKAAKRFAKVRAIVPGGTHRQDSVANGLKQVAADATYIAVHDAARPLVRPAQIEQVYAEAQRSGAAALAAPMKDTLKQADAARFVSGSISREGVYAMETPQIFESSLLRAAYEVVAARRLAITDEVSAVQQLGRGVVLVPNETLNLKITFPEDVPLADFVLRSRREANA
jgi:2-C-methyl-D-erythritol 4-phosphate cytidylyltransferase